LESLSCSEAIGCGLPCLISNSKYSAASQFALDDRFLFESDNPDQLAEKINYWYEHLEELRGREMKEKVLVEAEYYRFDRAVNEYEAFINEIVNPFKEDEIVLEPVPVKAKIDN